MSGNVGYVDRSGGRETIGGTLSAMLGATGRHGPGSAGVGGRGRGPEGVAVWAESADGLVVRVAMGERSDPKRLERELVRRARRLAPVRRASARGPYLRMEIAKVDAVALIAALEIEPGVEVVSLGRRLEIVKEVGGPENLDAAFGVYTLTGTHGIGHTRLSTESRVDLSHSQPFWAHGVPDLAVVHNGHITSYHRLRRIYEQEGVRFYTENDSEVIGIYLGR